MIPPSPSSARSAPPRAPEHPRLRRRLDGRSVALIATILLHVLILWLVTLREPLEVKPPSDSSQGAITYIAPLASAPPSPPRMSRPPSVKPPRVPAKRKPKAPPKPPTLARRQQPRAITPPDAPPSLATEKLTPAPNVAPQQDVARAAPEEDFSSRIEANRKRRAEAQDPAMAEAAPAESEAQRANRIAKDNIAFSQRRAAVDPDQNGGTFVVRNVGNRRAEFAFHGWSVNTRRNSTQVIGVEQGGEPDIEMAVVKRVITFIRTMRTGEFDFNSRRLGRVVTMNAGAAYQSELEAFLLKEFFPNYVRTAAR